MPEAVKPSLGIDGSQGKSHWDSPVDRRPQSLLAQEVLLLLWYSRPQAR